MALPIWETVLAFFALSTGLVVALIVWLALRFTCGALPALAAFSAVLFTVCFGILSLIA